MASVAGAVKAVWKVIGRDWDCAPELSWKLVRIPCVNPKFIKDPHQNRESVVQELVECELTSIGMSIGRWNVFPDGLNAIGRARGPPLRAARHPVMASGAMMSTPASPHGGDNRAFAITTID